MAGGVRFQKRKWKWLLNVMFYADLVNPRVPTSHPPASLLLGTCKKLGDICHGIWSEPLQCHTKTLSPLDLSPLMDNEELLCCTSHSDFSTWKFVCLLLTPGWPRSRH
jgi:hypothetical protein